MTVDILAPAPLSGLLPELSLPRQWRIFAEFFIAQRQFGTAEQYISALSRSEASAPDAELLKVRIMLAQGDAANAETRLLLLAQQAGAHVVPPDLAVFAARRILADQGRAATLKFLDQINTSADREAAILHIKLMIMARRFEDALFLVGATAVRSPFPQKAAILVLHGRILAMAKDYARAGASLFRALPYCEREPRIYYRSARIAEKADNIALAERWLSIAISTGSPSATMWAAMARLRIGSGNFRAAAFALRSALSLRDDSADRLLLARCLLEIDLYPAALVELKTLFEREPNHAKAKSLQVQALIRTGKADEAIAVAHQFIARNPLAPCVAELRVEIDRLKADENAVKVKFQSVIEGQWLPSGFRVGSPDAAEPKWNFLRAARLQGNVIGALMVREMIGRFSESRIGYLWAVVEPCVQIAVMLLLWYLMLHQVPYGLSIGEFMLTGVVSFFFFMNAYQRGSTAMTRYRSLLAHSSVTTLDLILASTLLELATQFGIFIVFTSGVIICGDSVRLNNPLLLALCLLMLWATGVGLGLFVDAMSRLVSWARLVGWAVNRKLFFASGLFFVPELLPKPLEQITMYNPLLHMIQLIRTSFSTQVHTPGLSLRYAAEWCIGTLVLGYLSHLAVRRK